MLSLVFVAGCGEALDARLVSVESVEPAELEPGALALVRGAGFAAGDDAAVRFVGSVHRPGGTATDVRIAVHASAVSASELAFVVTDELVERAGGRGTFGGSVEVEFALDGGGVISGRLDDVTLDFVPSESAEAIDRSLARTRAAEEFLGRAGIVISPDDADDEAGFRIDAVLRGTAAARAGLAKGDRIVEVDGVRVLAFADLVPMRDTSRPSIALVRPGRSTPILADLDLADPAERALPASLIAGVAFVFIAFLGTLTPVGRIVRHLAPSLVAMRQRLPGLVVHVRKESGSRFERARAVALAIASIVAGTLAFLALPFASNVLGATLHVGFIAVVVVLGRSLAPMRAETRARRIAIAAVELVAVATLTFAVSVASDRSTVAELVLAQGALPWEWAAFRDPCVVLAIVALFSTQVMAARDRSPGESAWRDVPVLGARLVCAALLAAVCLGGWTLPGVDGDPLEAEPWLRALGLALYLLKCWAMLVLPLGYRAHASAIAAPLVPALAAFAGTIAFAVVPGVESLRIALGYALLGGAIVVVGAIAARRGESKLTLLVEPERK